jgi:CRISPR-associated protein Cmr1
LFDVLLIKLKTLVPIWTGDINRSSDVLKETGLIGSIRWWYESLVRGMGGYACDPTDEDRCGFDGEAYARSGDPEDGLVDVCPACCLFGCTGWSSKFRLLATDAGDEMANLKLALPNKEFHLKLVELKPITDEERWLVGRTFYLIDKYGSMGGKTTLKPPKMPDYGLVSLLENVESPNGVDRQAVAKWLGDMIQKSDSLKRRAQAIPREYPNLRYFFFNPNSWIDREKMNRLVKIDRSGFLAGERGISKKVFSFKNQPGKRLWGYTKDEAMLSQVMKELEAMGVKNTRKGGDVLNEL